MKTLLIWILAGGLFASLRLHMTSGPDTTGCASVGCAPLASECKINPSELGLTPGQCLALADLFSVEQNGRQNLEHQAQRKLEELRAQLTRPELNDEELRELVREVSQLRESALRACVDEVLLVRSVLDGPQVQQLMESCCPEGSCPILQSSKD